MQDSPATPGVSCFHGGAVIMFINRYLSLLKYALLIILAGSIDLSAQYVGKTHVIPIVADGAVGDGTVYVSEIFITRMDNEPTNACNLETPGTPLASRFPQTFVDL